MLVQAFQGKDCLYRENDIVRAGEVLDLCMEMTRNGCWPISPFIEC